MRQQCCLGSRCFHQVATPREMCGHPLIHKAPAKQARPCGLMDKAPDFGSGDCRFESCHGRIIEFLGVLPSKCLAPGEARTHNPGISLYHHQKHHDHLSLSSSPKPSVTIIIRNIEIEECYHQSIRSIIPTIPPFEGNVG